MSTLITWEEDQAMFWSTVHAPASLSKFCPSQKIDESLRIDPFLRTAQGGEFFPDNFLKCSNP